MKRLLTTVIVAASLAALAPGAQAMPREPFAWKARHLVCNSRARHVRGEAYIEENGTSGTTRLGIAFVLQYFDGDEWRRVKTKDVRSGEFPNDAQHHTMDVSRRIFVPDRLHDAHVRLHVTFRWFGGQDVINREHKNGPSCFGG